MSAVSSRPVISAWSAISPFGSRPGDFADGLRSGRQTALPVPGSLGEVPVREACLIPGFDIATMLGRKGTRSMDRATALAVAAVDHLLNDEKAGRRAGIGEKTGLALGTSTGSVQSTMDFTRDSLTGSRPYLVDPARFPNTVMNCAAGQSAIWHRLRGPNATIAAGRATGLLALRYALRLQQAGRAAALVCGAVEEFSPARAWLAWHSACGQGELPVLGEGAALWLLEQQAAAAREGRPVLAEVAGLELGFAPEPGQLRRELAGCVRRALARAGARPEEVGAVAGSGIPGIAGDEERAAVADALAGHRAYLTAGTAAIGDTYAASAAFGVVALLAMARNRDVPPGCLALVTSAEARGVVGAVALRLG